MSEAALRVAALLAGVGALGCSAFWLRREEVFDGIDRWSRAAEPVSFWFVQGCAWITAGVMIPAGLGLIRA